MEDMWKDHEKWKPLHDQRVSIGQITEFTTRKEVLSWASYWDTPWEQWLRECYR